MFLERSPMITICMPAFNSAWSLPSSLSAVEKLDYPKDRIRIVLVDNCSEDLTPQILKDFQKNFGSTYESVVVISEKSNIPEARNICVSNSIGEYLLFIDSDILAPSDTVRRMLEFFASSPLVRIVGFPYWYESMSFMKKVIFSKQPELPYPTTTTKMGCTMIKKSLFNEIGLFDSKYAVDEDLNLTARANKAGYTVILDPTRTPVHVTKEKTRGIISQIMMYCAGLFKGDARYYFMILREHKPRWLIMRVTIYSLLTISIPLAAIGLITNNITWIVPFVTCYSIVFAYHFSKASGKWRFVNALLFPLFGVSFASGILKEMIRYYILGEKQ